MCEFMDPQNSNTELSVTITGFDRPFPPLLDSPISRAEIGPDTGLYVSMSSLDDPSTGIIARLRSGRLTAFAPMVNGREPALVVIGDTIRTLGAGSNGHTYTAVSSETIVAQGTDIPFPGQVDGSAFADATSDGTFNYVVATGGDGGLVPVFRLNTQFGNATRLFNVFATECTGITLDSASNEFILLCDASIKTVDKTTGQQKSTFPLPSGAQNGFLALDPATDTLWTATSVGRFTQLTRTGGVLQLDVFVEGTTGYSPRGATFGVSSGNRKRGVESFSRAPSALSLNSFERKRAVAACLPDDDGSAKCNLPDSFSRSGRL